MPPQSLQGMVPEKTDPWILAELTIDFLVWQDINAVTIVKSKIICFISFRFKFYSNHKQDTLTTAKELKQQGMRHIFKEL